MIVSAFTKSYGTKKVLSFPETEFAKGKIYAVIGPNGSAKSTMAKVLAGIEKSDSKNAVLKDCCVGYMPQKSFPFRMSVKNNIFLNGNNLSYFYHLYFLLCFDFHYLTLALLYFLYDNTGC